MNEAGRCNSRAIAGQLLIVDLPAEPLTDLARDLQRGRAGLNRHSPTVKCDTDGLHPAGSWAPFCRPITQQLVQGLSLTIEHIRGQT